MNIKKTYTAPEIMEIGSVQTLTAATGTDPRADFSEFAQVQPDTGSGDVCDGNPNNNPPGSNCVGG